MGRRGGQREIGAPRSRQTDRAVFPWNRLLQSPPIPRRSTPRRRFSAPDRRAQRKPPQFLKPLGTHLPADRISNCLRARRELLEERTQPAIRIILFERRPDPAHRAKNHIAAAVSCLAPCRRLFVWSAGMSANSWRKYPLKSSVTADPHLFSALNLLKTNPPRFSAFPCRTLPRATVVPGNSSSPRKYSRSPRQSLFAVRCSKCWPTVL